MRSSAPDSPVLIGVLAVAAVLAQPAPAVAQPAPAIARPAPATPRRAGAAALEGGRLGEALALYERALGPARSDARVWFDLCLVRYSAGDYGRALDACYRALPAGERRVIVLLERIAAGMRAGGVRTAGVIVPEPLERWFSSDRWLPDALLAAEPPPAAAGATRAFDPEPLPPPVLFAAIPAEDLDRLRGRRPTLPYHIPSRPGDYGAGLDVSARGGLLSYAPDTTPLVAGVRAEWRRRAWGAASHRFYFGEYLHATDKTGGIGALGYGGRGRKLSGSIGLAVPWGRSEGRRDVLIPDHTLALHGEVRLGVHRELRIDRSWAVTFEASLIGGFNLAKAAIRIGNKLEDACNKDKPGDCGPDTPDANPRWPLWHSMLQIGVSLGYRGRYPRYDRSDVFAPMGGS
jgi:hypothetical protein